MTKQIRETREHLDACLAELNQLRPTALLREHALGRDLSFRAGLPHFERTLELFHRLSRCDLDHVPLAHLKNITNDTANTVDQFRKILSFTGEDLDTPWEARDLLIDEVKDSFDCISTNFGIVTQWPRRHRHLGQSMDAAFTIGLCILFFALAVVAYYTAHNGTVADQLLNVVHRVRSS